MPGGIRSTEAAKRLGIDGVDAYRLLFAGVLDGGPGRDGVVYFDEAAVEAYLESHGVGLVAEASTGCSTGSAGTGVNSRHAATSQTRKDPGRGTGGHQTAQALRGIR